MEISRLVLSLLIACVVLPSSSGHVPTGDEAITHSLLGSSTPEHAAMVEKLRARVSGWSDSEIDRIARTIIVESHWAELDPEIVTALIEVESSWNPRAVSRVGAMGLMQLRESTALEVAAERGIVLAGAESLFDPELNIRLGIHYLARMIERFEDLDTALAAYNWGPTRIARVLREGQDVPGRYTEKVYRAAALI